MDFDSDHVTGVSDDNNNKDALLEDQHRTSVAEPDIYESINDDDDDEVEHEMQQRDVNADRYQDNGDHGGQYEHIDSDQRQHLTNEYELEEDEQENDVHERESESYELSGEGPHDQQVYENLSDEDVDNTADRHDEDTTNTTNETTEETTEETAEETAEAFGRSEWNDSAVRYENEAGQGELNETGMFSVLSVSLNILCFSCVVFKIRGDVTLV